MFVKSHGSAVLGIDALPIAAEVNITAGIGMYLVGLPDNAVRESQERIRAAFENCSYKMSGKKVVVNLSPADIRKEGSAYDLTIALGILAATEQLPAERLSRYIVMGELSLDGSVLPVRGALPMALAARDQGIRGRDPAPAKRPGSGRRVVDRRLRHIPPEGSRRLSARSPGTRARTNRYASASPAAGRSLRS